MTCHIWTNGHFSKHTLLVDHDLVGYAVRASPPANYGDVIQGVTAAIEKLDRTLKFCKPSEKQLRRGNFRTVSFGCSYGGGQTVSGATVCFYLIRILIAVTI